MDPGEPKPSAEGHEKLSLCHFSGPSVSPSIRRFSVARCSRGHANDYGAETLLRAFRAFGIPYTVERDRQYFRRREVIDGLSYLRVWLTPLMQSHWLDSPSTLGRVDSALGPLWQRNFQPPRKRRCQRGMGMAIHHCIQDAASKPPPAENGHGSNPGLGYLILPSCRELRQLLGREAFWIFRMWRESLGAWQVELNVLGAHRLANLDRLEQQVLDGFMAPSAPVSR